MALNSIDHLESDESILSAEFASADLDGVVDKVSDPYLLNESRVMEYQYNKASVLWMNQSFLKKITDAVKVDNMVRDLMDAHDQQKPKEEIGAIKEQLSWGIWNLGLHKVVVTPRANIERVNMAEIDLSDAEWDTYTQESEKFVDPVKDAADDRYRHNLTLAYARGQELQKHLLGSGYQWDIMMVDPVVVFPHEELTDDQFVASPGILVRTEYKILWERTGVIETSLNGTDVLSYEDSDMDILSRDPQGRPEKVKYGRAVITISSEEYRRWEDQWEGKDQIRLPLVNMREKARDEEGNMITVEVQKYINFWEDYLE